MARMSPGQRVSLLNRRRFLQFAGVSLWSEGLLRVLAARERPEPRGASAKACIILFQVGGPYQCDTFDPKPLAPEEIRGPFKPIRTSVTGLHVTEALPKVALRAKDFAVVRSVNHTIRCHNPAIYCSLVGREATDPMAVSNRTASKRTDHPHYASVLMRVKHQSSSMPGHVIIPDVTNNGPAKSPGLHAGYLGAAYDPFVIGRDPSADDFHIDSVGLPADVGLERFTGRRSLVQQLDSQQRQWENEKIVNSMGVFQQRAFSMLTSPRAKAAFDLKQEAGKTRERYGRNQMGQSTLLARRLVEAGVPFVTVFSHTDVDKGSWDTHNKHEERSKRDLLPPADQSFSALLEDLSARNLLQDVLVVWMGEFGRTPRMGVNFSNNTNNVGGRDHWCNCYSVVLAGGGVKGGRVVGSSDWIGGYPTNRPAHISDLAATIFHALGVDPRSSIQDILGQPHQVCDGYPIEELF